MGAVAAGKAKVADLELAVGVDEQISGLEVAVENVGGVNVLEAAEGLVDEGLEVGVGQWLLGADLRRRRISGVIRACEAQAH